MLQSNKFKEVPCISGPPRPLKLSEMSTKPWKVLPIDFLGPLPNGDTKQFLLIGIKIPRQDIRVEAFHQQMRFQVTRKYLPSHW